MAQKISRRGVVGALGIVMGGLVNAATKLVNQSDLSWERMFPAE